MKGLQGKVAVVAGGAGTIGSAILERLASEGCRTISLDIRPSSGASAENGSPNAWQVDLADESEVEAIFTEIAAIHGRIDLLVNAAGSVGPTSEINQTDLGEFDSLIRANLRSAFVTMRIAIQMMREQGQGGAIVNLASTAANRVRPGRSLYAMTKSAIIALSTAAALENAEHGIRVNCVSPGPIDSEMYRQMLDNEAGVDTVAPAVSVSLGQPEEVASLVAFLLSAEASHCTGHNHFVDGGATA